MGLHEISLSSKELAKKAAAMLRPSKDWGAAMLRPYKDEESGA
jgi:hypothetical protein